MSHVHKILVPMDGSPSSLAALTEAANLAEDLDANLDILHINAPDQFAVGSATSVATDAQVQAAKQMDDAIDAAKRRLGDRLHRRTESGDPMKKILEAAESEHADLIVMGTHGRVGRLHALVGSVAESVVRNAPCPVVTVRQPGGEEESFSERLHHRPGLARSSH